jgi:hypothetical protein
MLQQAAAQNVLGAKDHPAVRRLRSIAQKIIPHAVGWNPRARDWRWEVNLIGSCCRRPKTEPLIGVVPTQN